MPSDSFLKDYADNYDKFYKNKDYKKEALGLHKIFKPYKVKRVLDIACGTGNHLKRLKQMHYVVSGLDISEAMVAIARAKGLDVVIDSMQNFSYHGSWDAVICMFAAFDYVTDLKDAQKVLHNVYHALKPNGVFVFDFWNKPVVKKDYRHTISRPERTSTTVLNGDIATVRMYFDNGKQEIHQLRFYYKKDILQMLKIAGFKNIQMTPFDNDWSIQVVCLKPR
jgi:SAM-dependent methyltransferase